MDGRPSSAQPPSADPHTGHYVNDPYADPGYPSGPWSGAEPASVWPPGPTEPLQPSDRVTVTSLLLGVFGFLGITAILAVVLGHVGVSRVKRSGLRGIGMATIGLTLGYCWIVGITGGYLWWAQHYNHARSYAVTTTVKGDLVAVSLVESGYTDKNPGLFTNDPVDFNLAGFEPASGNQVRVAVGDGGYCAVAANHSYGRSGRWYLIDSRAPGATAADRISGPYKSAGAAEQACGGPVGYYATVTG